MLTKEKGELLRCRSTKGVGISAICYIGEMDLEWVYMTEPSLGRIRFSASRREVFLH